MESAGGLGWSTSAVIPALNEESSIGAVLGAIPRDLVREIIVVDGRSRDRTAAIAAACGATVLDEPERGYGRACARGAAHAKTDLVVFLDADGAADPGQIRRLIEPIAQDRADLVLGSRLAGPIAPRAMPAHQRMGNRLSASLIGILYGRRLTDLSPFRAVRRLPLAGLNLQDATYGWPTEMIVKALRAGWRVTEVPVACHPRIGGRSKIGGTARGSVLAAWHILSTIVRQARA